MNADSTKAEIHKVDQTNAEWSKDIKQLAHKVATCKKSKNKYCITITMTTNNYTNIQVYSKTDNTNCDKIDYKEKIYTLRQKTCYPLKSGNPYKSVFL